MPVQTHNPDVLSCLANLSSDEVFTPPALANRMLDLLPADIWRDPKATFLDPGAKSGVFLREIARRLIAGLAEAIPDEQARIDHVFGKQVFGLAITEMTALLARRSVYCSKTANGKYSVSAAFGDEQGHITFERIEHTWAKGRCAFCGASEGEYKRGAALETHAYPFIHMTRPEEVLGMKFDVIVGNPPYQLSTGGAKVQAIPLYHKFIQQAKKLNPRYLTMIVPSRWFSGGFGLDTFRDEMLNDQRLRVIHDYLEAIDVFPGVQIKGGVCYFLWDRDNPGDCTVVTHHGNEVGDPVTRPLLEHGSDVFIRYNEAIPILHKVQKATSDRMDQYVSSQRPFGLPTNFHGHKERKENDVQLLENGGIGYIDRNLITKGVDLIDKYKVFISRAGSGSDSFPHSILGKPFIGYPNSASTETYLAIGPFQSEEQCRNVISYITTRFFRFLVLLKKPTQDALRKVYSFVPVQDFNLPWTDEKLYQKYDLTPDEIAFIESMIRPMELNGE